MRGAVVGDVLAGFDKSGGTAAAGVENKDVHLAAQCPAPAAHIILIM